MTWAYCFLLALVGYEVGCWIGEGIFLWRMGWFQEIVKNAWEDAS